MLISTLWVSHAAIAPALPGMAKQFSHIHGADLLVKLSLTVTSLFIGLVSPFTGMILDRFGRLQTLYISLLLFSISGLSVIFLENLHLILISRAVLGCALGAMVTTILTLIGDYYEGDQRKKMVGLQSSFIAIGGIVYLGGNGILADISWHLPFLIYGIGLALLPLVIMFCNEPDKKAENGDENSDVQSINPPFSLLQVGWIIFSALLVSIFFIMIHTQLPFMLKEIGYQKNTWFGVVAIAFNITAVITSLLYPWLRSRFSFSMIYFFMFFSFAIGYFIFGTCTAFLPLIVGALISGIGVGFIMPNTSLWLLNLTSPGVRGKTMGVMTFSMFLGQFLSPLLIQPLTNYGSLQEIFLWSAVFMALFSLVYCIPIRKILN